MKSSIVKLFGLGVLAAVVVACGSSGGGVGGGRGGVGGVQVDAGTSGNTGKPLDFAGVDPGGPPVDLATPSGKLGCKGFIGCLNTEYTNNGGDFDAADATCRTKAKSTAPGLWEQGVGCGQQYCITQNACKLNSTQTQLVNQDGSLPADGTPCGTCLNNALAEMFEAQCVGTQYCNPATCQSTFDACLNDLP